MRLQAALEGAWDSLEAGKPPLSVGDADVDGSVDKLVQLDSAPDRGMVFAIVAGTAEDPYVDPGALQEPAGVDRRGQAAALVGVLTIFINHHALTLKLSKDPGVSNPWRELVIDDDWLSRRQRLASARYFVSIVDWLRDEPGMKERSERATALLDRIAYRVVELARGNAIEYPKFGASPRLAVELVQRFLATVGDRPDAAEAVVCAAARALAEHLPGDIEVERRDTNSPDPIDILLTRGDGTRSGIEVTDAPLSLAKLQHEVVAAMLSLGLTHATVVSRPPSPADAPAIKAYLDDIYRRMGQRVDLLETRDIEKWLSMPGMDPSVATTFLWGVGPELDRYSSIQTRRSWLEVLEDYVQPINEGPAPA
ncbi:MAG TPA: hypothetical protein VG815_02245 [Chloroflexota bacterium]|nr:hypothetical protein [Chloroflexota bacterium]